MGRYIGDGLKNHSTEGKPRSGGRIWPMATAMGKRSSTRDEPRQGRQKWLTPTRTS